jgi:transcriptional regulator with XRE-family HTH domain
MPKTGPRWTREELAMLAVVGDRVRQARQDAGMSQMDVWLGYGITHAYVGRVERGEQNATAVMLVRLATVFGVDPGSFLTGLRHTPELWPMEPGRRPKWLGPPTDGE